MTKFQRFCLLVLFVVWNNVASHADSGQLPQSDIEALETCLIDVRQGAGSASSPKSCIGKAALACSERPEGQTTPGMVACAIAERDWWDAKLNTAYQTLKDKIPAKDFSALKELQRHWITYRDLKCAFAREIWSSGSIGRPNAAWCLMNMTALRALELKDLETNGPWI